MVIKNAKLGNVENVTIIELGNGDVQVAYVHQKEEGYTGITFMNDIERPITTKHNTAGTTSDENPPDAMISFTNIESLEVLERALGKAKIVLRNMLD